VATSIRFRSHCRRNGPRRLPVLKLAMPRQFRLLSFIGTRTPTISAGQLSHEYDHGGLHRPSRLWRLRWAACFFTPIAINTSGHIQSDGTGAKAVLQNGGSDWRRTSHQCPTSCSTMDFIQHSLDRYASTEFHFRRNIYRRDE